MKTKFLCWVVISVFAASSAHAAITNPGFEQGWEGWVKIDKSGKAIAISGDANSGKKSAKITNGSGYFAQAVAVNQNVNYALSAKVLGPGILGVKVGEKLFFERKDKSKNWESLTVQFNSGVLDKITVFAQYNGKKGLFDDFSLSEAGGAAIRSASSISLGAGGLSPDFPPGRNFDLLDWHLTLPYDKDGNGKADRIDEPELAKGYVHEKYFYTGEDGGMVFAAPNLGAKTSKNTKYTRTELREMLRRGDMSIDTRGKGGVTNKNNWVFSTAPRRTQRASGGVDGALRATLAVNKVSATGMRKQVGRVIVGQIHAKDDEPIRVYYRKLPENEKGSIYAAHEPLQGEERWYEIIGSRADDAPDPEDGIALGEKFTYEIITAGHLLQLIISQDGKTRGSIDIDMTNSGFDEPDDYMYFKAGVYNQNNSGEPDELTVVTFYELENTHVGYDH